MADAGLYESVGQSGFTIEVEAGWYELGQTGTWEELDRLRAGPDTGPYQHDLDALVTTDRTDGLLTDRQRTLLETAVREGYVEVSRRCTLAEPADEWASTSRP